ncbi:MAG TPA: hypothetical protein VFO62_12445, partial [Candidatus Binatia bacterium]|nr:hypothetical protein [Candidatus Binatia bacterium]
PSVREVVVVAPPIAMLASAPRFAAGDCRATVIAAAHDDFAPIEELRAAFAGVEGARIVIVKGADHFFSSGGLEVIAAAAGGV